MQISLRAARVNAGLSQIETAKRLEVAVNTYRNWEKNPGAVSALRQRDISRLFQMPIDNINFLPCD